MFVTPLVALYRYSTSNHNSAFILKLRQSLHYIVILHQTTTLVLVKVTMPKLHYIVILHQTTTARRIEARRVSCIISLFYIKPQPLSLYKLALFVALYRYSTSNHN